MTVSPDGSHVYATGGLDILGVAGAGDLVDLDWIAVFSRDDATGALTWVQAVSHSLFCSFDVLFEFETYAVVSPEDEWLFATSAATAVTAFSRNPATGTLTFTDGECFFDALVGIDQGTNPGSGVRRRRAAARRCASGRYGHGTSLRAMTFDHG